MNSDLLRVQLSRLTWLLLGIIEAVLGFHLFFKLIGANPNAEFVQTIYQASAWLMQPFEGIATSPQLAGGVLDLQALIAWMTYLVAGSLLVQLLRALLPAHMKEQHASQA